MGNTIEPNHEMYLFQISLLSIITPAICDGIHVVRVILWEVGEDTLSLGH